MLGLGLHSLGGISASGSYSANSLTLGAAAGSNAITLTNAGARIKMAGSFANSYFYYDSAYAGLGGATVFAEDVSVGTNLYAVVLRNGGAGANSINLHPSAGINFDAAASNTVTISAGTIAGEAGGSGSVNMRIGGCMEANPTGVGNVGASGPDDLQTYQLPASTLNAANRGIRIKAWGTTANNANAKTVRLTIGPGPTALITKQLTASIAGFWKLEATILRTGASTQDYFAEARNYGGTTVSSTDGATVAMLASVGTLTQTETNALDIKVQSTVSTSNNDIVSEGLIVEFL